MFTDTDKKMKLYEVYKNQFVTPGNYIVVRLDGVTFSKVTKRLDLAKPFDVGFRDKMVDVVCFLMEKATDIEIGYTQSDEITLVFRQDTDYFGRRPEKIASVLAGMASAKLSTLVGEPVFFDGRVMVFPNLELVNENLKWRIDDSAKNCLGLYCHWGLIQRKGYSTTKATKLLASMKKADRNEFLFSHLGINFNDVPTWQKRGVLLYRVEYVKDGWNPKTETSTKTMRNRIEADFQTPHPLPHSTITNYIEGMRWSAFATTTKGEDN